MHLCRERGNRKNPVCKFQPDIPKKIKFDATDVHAQKYMYENENWL